MEERVNAHIVTEAQLIQTAIGSIMSKDSGKHFQKMIRGLNVETRVIGEEKAPQRLLPEGYEEE